MGDVLTSMTLFGEEAVMIGLLVNLIVHEGSREAAAK